MSLENRYEIGRMLLMNNTTLEALKDADKLNTELIEKTNEGFEGGCSLVSIAYLFGYESVMPSEEQEFPNSEIFFERFEEIVEERGLTLVMPNSSGEFLSLLESDDFYGCIIVTETENNDVGHMLAVRPIYNKEGEDEEDKFMKKYAVVDVGRKLKTGIMNEEEMVDYYSDSMVIDHSDGSYFRGIFVIMNSDLSEDQQY